MQILGFDPFPNEEIAWNHKNIQKWICPKTMYPGILWLIIFPTKIIIHSGYTMYTQFSKQIQDATPNWQKDTLHPHDQPPCFPLFSLVKSPSKSW